MSIEYDDQGRPTIGNAAVMDVTEQRAAVEAFARMNDALDERLRERTAAQRAAVEAFARMNDALDERLRERTAALLEEGRRRLEAEALLHQAQKMEAIGQLTGGIAHDFNNLLHAIVGNIELVLSRIERITMSGSGASVQTLASLVKLIGAALKAAQNGAKLTLRLLAFARRQKLEAVNLDLNGLISGISDMIQHSLSTTVAVEMRLEKQLWVTTADANQLETVILNLVVNARDAMPAGGRLVIETANVSIDEGKALRLGDTKPGDYVMLRVSDAGAGIPAFAIEHVFEPFFTTKDIGHGTGLRLAMDYGFVKQSLGSIHIDSKVGEGTSVKMYLPSVSGTDRTSAGFSNYAAETTGQVLEITSRPAETTDRMPEAIKTETPPPGRARRTILAVDDNDDVRDVVPEELDALGYQVITARDADCASVLRWSGMMRDPVHRRNLFWRQMTADEYRAKWDLPPSYPMVAPGYAETRSNWPRIVVWDGRRRFRRTRRSVTV